MSKVRYTAAMQSTLSRSYRESWRCCHMTHAVLASRWKIVSRRALVTSFANIKNKIKMTIATCILFLPKGNSQQNKLPSSRNTFGRLDESCCIRRGQQHSKKPTHSTRCSTLEIIGKTVSKKKMLRSLPINVVNYPNHLSKIQNLLYWHTNTCTCTHKGQVLYCMTETRGYQHAPPSSVKEKCSP